MEPCMLRDYARQGRPQLDVFYPRLRRHDKRRLLLLSNQEAVSIPIEISVRIA